MGRREELTDAALEVVAATGLKGLSHRAVDTAAGAPPGSTSNYYRTRQALVDGVVERIEQFDLEVWAGFGPPPGSLGEFTRWLARFAVAMTGEHARISRVRLALFLDDPQRFSPGHHRFLDAVAGALDGFGVPDARTRATAVLDYLDGVVLHVTTVRPSPRPRAAAVAQALDLLLTTDADA
ncbi:TetR/AcrR family transcriptional regulator [Blastococcus sp. Marseille-P5729]|uniref:TetR/AcrR family transcriptional regulator n=1 Tax=Blastococcus sp. Marseille-P5729 TaxID=2086582 RepID=UPI000D1062F8|nr:TetR/AcrR family transcriptional regulator [Blastococcus sp. Marseille-P5729]